jgi:prepilin-type N-terminal cleavage/methylation domain-containing protein
MIVYKMSFQYNISHNTHYYFRPAFTIVELLVVIVVIGILASLVIVSYSGISNQAIVATIKSDLTNATTQLEIDKTSDSLELYPSDIASINNGQGLNPSSGNSYVYRYYSTSNTYCIASSNSSTTNVYHYLSSEGIVSEGICPVGTTIQSMGTTNSDFGASVIQTSDGGYMLAGYSNIVPAQYDMVLTKYDLYGDIEWQKSYGGVEHDTVDDCISTSDGGFVILGTTKSFGSGGDDILIVKINSSGSVEWSRSWGGSGYDRGASVIQTADNSYVVTGHTGSYGAGSTELVLIKYSASGNLLWNKTWGSNLVERGHSVSETSDGGYLVLGESNNFGAGGVETIILKYNSSGNIVWKQSWGGSSHEYAKAIESVGNDEFIVVGMTQSFGLSSGDMFIAKYDSSGILLWNRTWGGSAYEYTYSAVGTSDGGYAVVGKTTSFGSGLDDGFLVKYDSSGSLLWNRTWGGSSNEDIRSISECSDGGFVMTGQTQSFGFGGNDSYIIKYDKNGDIFGCNSPMCQSPSATTSDPSASVSSVAGSTSTPSAGASSPVITAVDVALSFETVVESQ